MAGSPGEWYNGLPPVSKALGTACFCTTAALQLGVLPLSTVPMDWGLVLRKFHVWRMVSTFVFLGGFSFPFVMRLLWIARYGVQLETGPYAGRTADFAWALTFSAGALLLLPAALPGMGFQYLGPSLVFVLVYLWSREFPDANTNIMGLVQLKGAYLPWGFLAVEMLMGGSPYADLAGIMAGHLYYHLSVIVPRTGGQDYIPTPDWVRALVGHAFGPQYGGGAFAAAANQPRAFRGRGRRLGGN